MLANNGVWVETNPSNICKHLYQCHQHSTIRQQNGRPQGKYRCQMGWVPPTEQLTKNKHFLFWQCSNRSRRKSLQGDTKSTIHIAVSSRIAYGHKNVLNNHQLYAICHNVLAMQQQIKKNGLLGQTKNTIRMIITPWREHRLRLFRPVNRLVDSTNLWLILSSKI